MSFEQYVGKYVDVTYPDGTGGSGWVSTVKMVVDVNKEVEKQPGIPTIVFDYGMGFPVTEGTTIEEVEPPPGDKGMFHG